MVPGMLAAGAFEPPRRTRPSRPMLHAAAAWLLWSAGVMMLTPSVSRAADAPIVFSATGDIPYGDSEVSVFQDQVNDHNVYSPSDFLVHLGDIFSGSESCSEFRYSRVADIMHTLTVPAYIVPGDNETIDCSSSSSGWQLWTEYFMRFEDYFCGAPITERQTGRQENFAFVKNGVLFVGINLVGGDNDVRILQDDATWASQQLTAKKASVRAAVFFAQAGPGDNHSTFFNSFVSAAASFGKPVLYMHGDGHAWIQDRPFSGAQNVLRVQVDNGGAAPPVQVTVSLSSSPFQFNRNPWSGSQPYERPPCVDAGPDRSVAAGASITLTGEATDNWVPNNPPRLTYAWSKVSGPGTATFSSPTSLTTTSSFSLAGTYVVRLTVNDGAASSSDDLTVTVTGSGSNQAPVAANDAYTLNEDASLVVAAPGVLGNDTDGDGDPLTTSVASAPAHGTLTLQSNGGFTYTPATNYNGADAFTYTASDGHGGTDGGSVALTINPATDPPAAANDSYAVVQNTSLVTAAPGVLGNDTDPDGDALTATLVTSTAHGSLTLNANGSFTYAPVTDFVGTDGFTYRARDPGGLTSNATVTVQVTQAPDRSPVAGDDAYTLNEDASLVVAAPGVLGNDTDADGDPLTASVASAPAHGTLSLQSNGGFTYTPATNYRGADTFSYTASDGRGGTDGGSVALTINPAPDPPAAANDSYTVVQNTSLVTAAPGVLGNDTDPDGDPLTATLVTSTAHGSLTLNANGSFTYAPATGFVGTDGFTYRARDPGGLTSNASVTIQVTLPPPVAIVFAPVADAYTSRREPTSNFGAATELRVRLSNQWEYKTYLRFNVSAFNGTLVSATLRLYATNGSSDGGSVYTISNNYRGTTTPWTETGINWDNGPDMSGSPLANGGAVAAGAWAEQDVTGSIAGGGTYCYGLSNQQSDQAAYNSREASSNRPQLVLLVQQGSPSTNTPPVANADGYSVSEDNVLTVAAPGVLGNDTDADGDPLTVASSGSPAHGAVSVAANGSFSYTPAANYNGPDSFTYTASDGRGGVATATVSLSVTAVNDPPVAAADAWSATAGQTLNVAAPGVLGNDTDPDGNPLTAVLATGVSHGTLTLNANGSFAYTPASGFTGTDSFAYKASDGTAQSTNATVTLTVGGGSGGGGPVVFQELRSGGSTGSASVATASALTAVSGHLYLAAVASKSSVAVTGVSGMGLTWTRVRSQCAARGQTSVEVWMGRGTPVSGTVSASLQTAATNAVILVARYSGADPTSPVGNILSGNNLGLSGACSGGVDTDNFTFNLTTTSGNVVFGAVAARSRTLTPGAGYVKRGDIFQGADSGTMAGVSIMDRTASAATTTVNGTVSSATDWAVVALEVRPATTAALALRGEVQEPAATPTAPGAFRVYPNPFTHGTSIEYTLPSPALVEASVYNVQGQRLRTLIAGRQDAGTWRTYWDGRSDRGAPLDPGVYFIRARIGGVLRAYRIALLR